MLVRSVWNIGCESDLKVKTFQIQIVEDREVNDMARSPGAYRPGEITDSWWCHCVGHTPLLGKTTEESQEVVAETLHLGSVGLEWAVGKQHCLPGLGKPGANTPQGKWFIGFRRHQEKKMDLTKCWAITGSKLRSWGEGPQGQAELCPQRKKVPT